MLNMLIDTHSHLNFNSFKDDSKEIIQKCLDSDIWMINVGAQYSTSKRALEISKNYKQGVYASVGLHPIHMASGLVKIKADPEETLCQEEFDYEKYKKLALSENVKAIGEIGLDYYWKPKTKGKLELFKEKQKDLLLKQLKLAKDLNLPVIFHCRMAHKDLIDFLKNETRPEKAVAHGFVGNTEELTEYLNFGYYIGCNGIIFKKIEGIDFEKNIKKIPLERILLETDCPYLNPLNKEQRNTPLNLKYIAQKIAEIKKISFEKVAETTFQNAKDLFSV